MSTITTELPMPPAPISGPSAWRGADMKRSTEWIHQLTDDERAELHLALDRVRGRDLLTIGPADFPLPTFAAVLDAIRRELLHGRGFVLIRGLEAARYTLHELATIYWGIGAYLGKARSQNAAGHALGHVRDIGRDADDPNERVYQTNRRQNYHTDSVDIVGLLCVNKAKRGGLSSIVSSVTIYNQMRARAADLAAVLFEPMHTDRRGEVPAGMKPWFAIPVFNWYAGALTTMYVRRYIESAQRFEEVPRLTEAQRAAMDLFDALVEEADLHLFMDFEPGDIQLVHNHQILHDRTAFEDWPEPERKRHLLRLWLCPPDGRPLPPCFAARYGGVTIGDRGGIVVPDARLSVPL
jgi:hypothetical protein